MADRRKYYREYRRRHKEEYREYARQWREKNPEKVKLMKERSLARTPNTKKKKPSAAKNREYQRRYRRRHSQKISEKNRKLVQKLGHMSQRTTREKLISYLSEEAKRQNSASFAIPFNRQQLADFLSVDRSAMSNELCKMRKEGLLEFDKNKFRLL